MENRVRRVSIALVLAWTCSIIAALAAGPPPVITEAGFGQPAEAKIGERLLISAQFGTGPVEVLFSDGTSPVVPATIIGADPERGFIAAVVPAGAVSGNIRLRVDGVDAPLYYLRITGVAPARPAAVAGTVSFGGTPVAGALVALLRPKCDDAEFVDAALTNAAGQYAMNGFLGEHMVMVFSPVALGVAPGVWSGELTGSEIADIPLQPGVPVTGRVVDAGTGLPIASAMIEFDGEGHERVRTDSSGNFTAHLSPSTWEMAVMPPPGDAHASKETDQVDVGTMPLSLGDIPLATGVRIGGFVRDDVTGLPLPAAEVEAQIDGQCCEQLDSTETLGDGSYALYVPANTTYRLVVRFAPQSAYVDAEATVAVAGAPVTQHFDVGAAALITGRVMDRAGVNELPDFPVQAFDLEGSQVAWAQTCGDGNYTLRVPPSTAGYVIAAIHWEGNYAFQAWDGTAAGTPFVRCEGLPVVASSAGSTVAGIDFHVEREAVVEGSVFTQASGCTGLSPEAYFVWVDDGQQHDCPLGNSEPTPGGVRVRGLPPSSVVPRLRVCINAPGLAPQCHYMRRTGYTPITVPAGGTANVEFCLGDRPTTPIRALTVMQSMTDLHLAWTPSTDLYHFQYKVWAGHTVRPSGAPNFPTDPSFWPMTTTFADNWTTPLHTVPGTMFFLVGDVGPTGTDGPSGYGTP